MTKYKNLEGERFGKLLVIKQTDDPYISKNGNIIKGIRYYCDCDCGNKNVLTLGNYLVNGNKKSCGCMSVGGTNIIDLTGKRFGNLIVLERVDNDKSTHALWKCKCDCGNIVNVIGISLRNGTKSCGCHSRLNPEYNMIGMRFGNLIVESRYDTNTSRGLARWNCVCDCGNKIVVNGNTLRNGNRKSCGCLSIRTKPMWKGIGDMPGSYYTKIKNGAKSRGYEFSISKRYMWLIYVQQNKKCSLTGMGISFKDKTASIDRIDSSKGYIENNIQWVHKDINKMKLDHSQEYFINICKMVYENVITPDR